MILTDDQCIALIKANQTPAQWVKDARKYSAELSALINGENFSDILIAAIEKLEDDNKQDIRKKYSRNIVDFFERIFVPIQNVFTSMGGVKDYNNGEYKMSDANTKILLEKLSNIRDGKSLERFIETKWINLYHTDPSGVLQLTYTNLNGKLDKIYPIYQSIGSIRNYEPCGQLVEWILFEPDTKTISGAKLWKIIDDGRQRIIIERGESFVVSDDPLMTFEHPFGVVPVIINSDITDKYGYRLSPIFKIEEIAKEYARDQSIKTIYKFLQGFPKHWRRTMYCMECKGNAKDGSEPCKACKGTGLMGNPDVAQVINLPLPKNGEPPIKGDDIMGYSSPDLETWKQFNEELERLEESTYQTMWGVSPKRQITKTATEIHYDMQPQINKLNQYANVAEWIEWIFTEWIANAIDTAKKKEDQIALIVYGRRYILEGIDTIQQKYEKARECGDNTIIVDGLFDELLIVKFKNDPAWMAIELKKAAVEPYIHQSIAEINDIFGAQEAARKIYFQKFWKALSDSDLQKQIPDLQKMFDDAFNLYLPTIKIEQAIVPTIPPGSVPPNGPDPKQE